MVSYACGALGQVFDSESGEAKHGTCRWCGWNLEMHAVRKEAQVIHTPEDEIVGSLWTARAWGTTLITSLVMPTNLADLARRAAAEAEREAEVRLRPYQTRRDVIVSNVWESRSVSSGDGDGAQSGPRGRNVRR